MLASVCGGVGAFGPEALATALARPSPTAIWSIVLPIIAPPTMYIDVCNCSATPGRHSGEDLRGAVAHCSTEDAPGGGAVKPLHDADQVVEGRNSLLMSAWAMTTSGDRCSAA